jgi:hypothetical protein
VDFQLTSEQKRLQHKCRELAADFASRSGLHDRDASHPVENYDRLRRKGSLERYLADVMSMLGGRSIYVGSNLVALARRGSSYKASKIQPALSYPSVGCASFHRAPENERRGLHTYGPMVCTTLRWREVDSNSRSR